MIVNGGNVLVLKADALGSTAGGTSIGGAQNQGTLQFDSSAALGGGFTVAEGITLNMRSSLVANSASSMKPHFNNLGGNTTLSGLINGVTGGAVTKISSDGGLLNISNELRQSGATPTASTRITHLQGSGQAVISGLITQALNISHRLDKMGTGTWRFTNAGNTFSGGVRIVEGTLEVTGLGNGGATASVLGTASSTAGNLQLNGGTLRYVGTSAETSDRLFNIGAAGATLDASGDGALVFSNTGAIEVANGGATGIQFSFANASTTVAVNDSTQLRVGMDIGGVAGLEPGTKITAINHSAGLVTIDTATTAASVVANTGTASGVFDRTLELTGSNTGLNTLSGTLGNAANGGKLGVTKSGAGTWVLGGNSTYSGPTTVSAGTLYVNGSLSNSAVTVNGGTLGGNSSDIGGGVTVGLLGSLAPGNSIGTLNAASVDLNGTLLVEYGPTSIDMLNVTGLLDLTGSTVSFINFAGDLDGTSNYIFATYGSLVGTFSSGSAPAGYAIDYAFGGNNIALVVIPEPTSALLGSLGLLGLLSRRRRC
ncbi:MAG: autotransporter-associated beta strand repeat-containing protein [Akkermansiaceae bacterium]|nr:autotransporter-associated beta strand repeat-containing protein [Akkermansiaceae bacterium]